MLIFKNEVVYCVNADTLYNIIDIESKRVFGGIMFLPLYIECYGVSIGNWFDVRKGSFKFFSDMTKGVSLFLFRIAIREYLLKLKEDDYKKSINNPVNNAVGWKI